MTVGHGWRAVLGGKVQPRIEEPARPPPHALDRAQHRRIASRFATSRQAPVSSDDSGNRHVDGDAPAPDRGQFRGGSNVGPPARERPNALRPARSGRGSPSKLQDTPAAPLESQWPQDRCDLSVVGGCETIQCGVLMEERAPDRPHLFGSGPDEHQLGDSRNVRIPGIAPGEAAPIRARPSEQTPRVTAGEMPRQRGSGGRAR